MIVEVVVGSVLIILGLCALIGLPTLVLRLQRRDERGHQFEHAIVAEFRDVEDKIARVYENEIASGGFTRDATESSVVYHS